MDTKELKPIEQEIASNKSKIDALVIKTEDDYNAAASLLINFKKIAKDIKSKKEELTKPINESLKKIRAMFLPYEGEIETLESTVASKLRQYRADEAAKAAKQQEKIAEKLESGKITETKAAMLSAKIEAPVSTVKTDTGKLVIKKIKKVRFSKPTADDIVKLFTMGLVMIDEVAARRRALSGEVIPCAEVYEDETF